MKHHLDNFEGAFPLLLIGSVLVVYAGILASQEIGSHSSHLPLWGLLAGVGAVIVGAGIYSTFLEPGPVSPPKTSDEWATTGPRAEVEARSRAPQPTERLGSPSSKVPIWWEGPDTPSIPVVPKTKAGPGARPATPTPPTSAPSPARRGPPAPTARPVPRPAARYSYKELTDELSELEALVYGGPSLGPPKPPRSAAAGGPAALTCMDCDRPLTLAASPSPCRSCGRGLCARCAASSRSEDGEIRCIDCRARAA